MCLHYKKVRQSVVLAFLLMMGNLSFAQFSLFNGKFEAGVTFGPTIFMGDLGGNKGEGRTFLKDYDPQATTMYYGGYLQYYPSEVFGFRLQLGFGDLKGSDNYVGNSGSEEIARIYRNRSFRSSMQEAMLIGEFYPTYLFEQTEGNNGKFRPYGLLGVGFLKFNPQGLYTDPSGATTWIDLQPLRTEGQGIPGAVNADKQPYKLSTLIVPMGAGFKYYFSESVSFGLELLHRKTFTDYIDDVSTVYPYESDFDNFFTPDIAAIAKQMSGLTSFKPVPPSLTDYPREGKKRGNPNQKDAYFSINFRLGIRLGANNANSGYGGYYNKRCPSW